MERRGRAESEIMKKSGMIIHEVLGFLPEHMLEYLRTYELTQDTNNFGTRIRVATRSDRSEPDNRSHGPASRIGSTRVHHCA